MPICCGMLRHICLQMHMGIVMSLTTQRLSLSATAVRTKMCKLVRRRVVKRGCCSTAVLQHLSRQNLKQPRGELFKTKKQTLSPLNHATSSGALQPTCSLLWAWPTVTCSAVSVALLCPASVPVPTVTSASAAAGAIAGLLCVNTAVFEVPEQHDYVCCLAVRRH